MAVRCATGHACTWYQGRRPASYPASADTRYTCDVCGVTDKTFDTNYYHCDTCDNYDGPTSPCLSLLQLMLICWLSVVVCDACSVPRLSVDAGLPPHPNLCASPNDSLRCVFWMQVPPKFWFDLLTAAGVSASKAASLQAQLIQAVVAWLKASGLSFTPTTQGSQAWWPTVNAALSADQRNKLVAVLKNETASAALFGSLSSPSKK